MRKKKVVFSPVWSYEMLQCFLLIKLVHSRMEEQKWLKAKLLLPRANFKTPKNFKFQQRKSSNNPCLISFHCHSTSAPHSRILVFFEAVTWHRNLKAKNLKAQPKQKLASIQVSASKQSMSKPQHGITLELNGWMDETRFSRNLLRAKVEAESAPQALHVQIRHS